MCNYTVHRPALHNHDRGIPLTEMELAQPPEKSDGPSATTCEHVPHLCHPDSSVNTTAITYFLVFKSSLWRYIAKNFQCLIPQG